MKKYIPQIMLALVFSVAVFMLLIAEKQENKKVLNERLSFRVKDKIPYGMWVAYNNLQHLFPDAKISINRKAPGKWDSLSVYDSRQALVIVSPYFFPGENEMEKLIDFAKYGNDVFISCLMFGTEAQRKFKISTNFSGFFPYKADTSEKDILRIALQTDSLKEKIFYQYPGTKLGGYFYKTDRSRAYRLGFDEDDNVNFIKLKAGKGHIYVHTSPMAFSNYFLLHKSNISYYETALSFLPKDVKQVVWDEYFVFKRYSSDGNVNAGTQKGKGIMDFISSHKSLSWAFWLSLLLLLLYVLNEMRRRQRFMPVIKKPVNDSLEFVKTIGRLYYEKNDQKNLCRKMSTYFLEHIRHRYNLPTARLDAAFVQSLQFKSGYPEMELKYIINFINDLETTTVTDGHLKIFYQKLESFYKQT